MALVLQSALLLTAVRSPQFVKKERDHYNCQYESFFMYGTTNKLQKKKKLQK